MRRHVSTGVPVVADLTMAWTSAPAMPPTHQHASDKGRAPPDEINGADVGATAASACS